MEPLYCSKPTGRKRRLNLPRLLMLGMIGILVVSSCQLPTLGRKTPTAAPPELPPELTHTPPMLDSGLEVIDDGSALPPKVVEQYPQGGQELPPGGQIELTFDQPMDTAKTSAVWQFIAPDGAAVRGEITWSEARTLRFQPAAQLQPGTLYTASLTDQAASSQGVSLAEPINIQFVTMGELQVSQVFPKDAVMDVASDAVITVIFNRPVVPLVVAEEQADLPTPLNIDPPLSGKGEWVNTSVYAFRPDPGLKGATTYDVTVKAGLADALGESQLAEDYTWGFTTAQPSTDRFETSSGKVNPEDNLQNVLLEEYFSIFFLQPMDPASSEASLSLISFSGEPATLITDWNDDFTQVVITPTQRLSLGTSYTLRLDSQAQAADGGALDEGLAWNFSTVPPPAILSTSPANGSVQNSFSRELSIKFASPMRLDTIKERVAITPQPEGEFEWWYNEWDWSMVAFVLQPSTQYEVRFLPGMQDIYGDTILEEKVIRFTTTAYSPSANLRMPYDTPLLRAEGPPDAQEFFANYRNVSSLSLELHSLTPSEFLNFLTGKAASYQFDPPPSSLVWESKTVSRGSLNERVLESFRPLTASGNPIPPGFYFLGLQSPEVYRENPFDDERMIMVASANMVFKSSSTDSLIWLTDLESGQPLAGVPVNIYDQNSLVVGQGVTDKDGLLHLQLPTPEDPYEDRFALVDDGSVFAFTSSLWGSGVSLYDYGIWSSYYAPANQPTTYVYTERPIYRPGQPVYFKGILRLDDDLEYSLPDQSQVKVKITSFQETVYEEDLDLSSIGSFDGQLNLDSEAVLGYYTLEVFLPGRKEVVGSVTFSVAEYRKPEFQVSLSASPEDVLAGEDFTVKVQADYYSGGGVADALVDWTLTSEPFRFVPPDKFSSYSFEDFEEYEFRSEEGDDQGSKVVAEGQGHTDNSGRFSLSLPADLSGFKTSRSLTFEATLTDVSKTAVSGRTTLTAHRSRVYPGLKPGTYVGVAGEEETFEFLLLDWDGEPLLDHNLSVEIVERRWHSVQEQDPTGRIEWKSSVEEIPVASFEDLTTDQNGLAFVSFVPPNGGIFRARVTALDDKGNPGRASAYMWVTGKDFIPWRQTNDRSFDLVADRANYVPGDTAEILIASPFQGKAYALVTFERGRVRRQEVVLLTSNSTVYKLPVSADMIPNAFVSVVVIKGVDDTNPRPNFKMGILEISVAADQRAISVELTTDQATYGPGDQVLYSLRTRNFKGDPISAEVSLSLSDLATLSLLPPNSAPILEHFYSRRTLGVWTSIPLVQSLDEFNLAIKEDIAQGLGMGSGGGKGVDELGVVEVRQDFPDTAFWDAYVITNENGEASIAVTLPDSLTTWRMDARAVNADTLVGQTALDIISTRALLVRPQTPRFFVVNDHVRLGAAVHNNTDQDLEAQVSLTVQGLTLLSEATQTIQISALSQSYVTWDGAVDQDAQRVDLIFSVESDGLKDASRPPQGTLDDQGIPVYHYEARETVGTSGMMTAGGTRLEAISLPRSLAISEGELTIRVSPSLAAGMTDGLTYLEHYPHECVEQTISRFLPNIITARALKSANLEEPQFEANLRAQVDTALQRLYKWQNPDGGWGWWSDEKSDQLTSAYVILGLVEAQETGYKVSEGVIERGLNFLRTQLKRIERLTEPELVNRQAFSLYVLARAGEPDVSKSVQLYDQRQRMFLYARAFLAHTLYIIDASDPRLDTLLSDFNSSAILSATGSHWEEESYDRWNWNTDTRSTAIILSVLSLIDPGNPLNANATRWLMCNRSNGHWRGTQETAWSLMALTNWMVASGELEANYKYAVALNSQRLGGGLANAETLRQSLELTVQVSELLKDQANRLAFARDEGTGNLYYTAHLDVSLPVEETKSLDQGIVVSRSYYRLDDLDTPVSNAQQGELLLARLTIVAPNALHYVLVDDPLPAGLEAVDQTLSTSPQSLEVPQVYSWDDVFWRGWGWWFFTHKQLRDEKVVLSANSLPAGTYIYTYLVRAGSVGVFRVIPPTAQEFYFPEVYGRGEGGLFTVTP